jgi:hypothetical protein
MLQAAVEATKDTSRIVLDAPMIGLIVTNGVLIVRDVLRTRKAKKNGNGKQPGDGDTCKTHGDAIVRLETEQKNTDKAIAEIRGYFITLLERMPPKD